MTPQARLVLLAGPSGSGKTHLAEESGLPLLDLDDFYKDGDDPSLPRHPTLGIVDWDDPRSWDAEGALAALEAVCRDGSADVPVYDISRDGRVGSRRFELGGHRAYVGRAVAADRLECCEGTFGIPGLRVVPVDDAERGVPRQARVVAVLVEVVEIEQRQPGLLGEVRLPGPRGAGEQHEPGLRSHQPRGYRAGSVRARRRDEATQAAPRSEAATVSTADRHI